MTERKVVICCGFGSSRIASSPLAALTLLAGQRLHNCLPLLRWLWTGVRGERGLAWLLANSSLNSRFGMQDGPAQSPPACLRDSQEPWPGLRSPAGMSSSFLCFSHRHTQMGVPWSGRGQGSRALGSDPAPSGGHWFLSLGVASLRSNSLGDREQTLGGPVPNPLQNLGRSGIGRVQS